MVDLGRMDLLEVPAHCRQQVAQMLGREDELNPPDTVPEEPPIDDDETESDDPGEGDQDE